MATSNEIKEELVTIYGYAKNDFLTNEGKKMNFKQLEALLRKEKKRAKDFEAELESDLDELDEFNEDVIESKLTKFKDDDLITVMAGINGQLVHHSPVGNGQFKFNGFGQKQTMPYKELKAINNLVRTTFENGWIIILNKDLIQEFGLEEEYKVFLTPNKVNEILSMKQDDLRETIKELPKSMRTTLIDSAKARYNAGTLDSGSVIKVFEELYDVSFDDNLPLNDIVVN